MKRTAFEAAEDVLDHVVRVLQENKFCHGEVYFSIEDVNQDLVISILSEFFEEGGIEFGRDSIISSPGGAFKFRVCNVRFDIRKLKSQAYDYFML